ncbi:MAG: polysaccharide deacetylase family protein [Candidatus Cryosericum sp.]
MEKLTVQSEVARRHMRAHHAILALVTMVLVFSWPAAARGSTRASESAPYFYNDRVVVLTFHDVQPVPTGEWSVTPAKFEQTLTLLRSIGFEFISPPEFADFVERSTPIPPNALLLTFDDGLEDMYVYALPILERLQIPCLDNVIGSRMGVSTSCLTAEQVGKMATSGLVWIGGHSFDLHRDETVDDVFVPTSMVLHQDESEFMRTMRLTDDAKRVQSAVEAAAGASSRFYACPYGSYDDTYLSTVEQAGFQFVFNSQPGAVYAGGDPLRLPRVDIGHQRFSFFQVFMAIRCGAIGKQLPLWQAGKIVLSDTPVKSRVDDGVTALAPNPSMSTP